MIAGTRCDPPALRSALRESRTGQAHPEDPNAIAHRLIGRDYLSHSSISAYQKCPLRFYFHYVAGLQSEFKSAALVFGGVIHAAIELHFCRLFEGEPAPSVDELIDAFDRAWRAEIIGKIRYGKSESEDSLRDLARRMLKAFRVAKVSNLDTSLIGVEEELRAPLVDGCPDILGRLDVITLARNALRVIDFKTSRSRWDGANLQEAAPQLHLYAELVRPLADALGVRKIQVELVVLTKTKEPSIETHSLTPEPGHITRTKTIVQNVWAAIRAKHFYPAPSMMKCPSCPYAQTCQQWGG